MTHQFDEFSKSLAESLPRRESLRRLGLVFGAAILGRLGLDSAWAATIDPCKAFCKCKNRKQQDQCLRTCKACGNDPRRLLGSCGNFWCCGPGLTACGDYCADLSRDAYNCGGCGNVCPSPGPNEYVACVDGVCQYACADGYDYCDGVCTFLWGDPNNCGACGNVCPDSAPACWEGICGGWCPDGQVRCNGVCTDISSDPYNCGGCGIVCPSDSICMGYQCVFGGGGW